MDVQDVGAWAWLDAKLESLSREIQTIRSTAAKCPVCEGCGSVPNNFYKKTVEPSSSRTQCRSCHGKGVVFPC